MTSANTYMADIMDPQQVEEQSQAEQENYKVYKRRWLVLFAMFSVILVVGLHKCLISIASILCVYVGMTQEQYDSMTQVSMVTIILSVFIIARLLDYYGLRRMAYLACAFIICANGLKALCCWDDEHVFQWIKDHRFQILFLSEAFVGLAQSIALCVPAKVAVAWFAHYESTLALVIANCGMNIGVGFSNYFTPVVIQTTDDMYKLSYMFIVSGLLVTFIVLTCVTRSSPKIPPHSNIMMSDSTFVPLRSGLKVMMSNPSYILLMLTLAMNQSTLGVEQLVLDDILHSQGYDDKFCGTLIAHSFFFGTFFMLMGAAWVDNSANYVKVSRISSILCALGIVTFNISIILPNIKNVILVTNIMASFGCSLMYPSLFQVGLRCASTILPEATVSAIAIVLLQITQFILMNVLSPLEKLSYTNPKGYQAPMVIFSFIIMVMNVFYATYFTAPSREELRSKIRIEGGESIIEESIAEGRNEN